MKKQPTNIKPISKEHLYVKVAGAIVAYIRREGLKIGDKLPSERQLAAMLLTGRNTVREAISAAGGGACSGRKRTGSVFAEGAA